MWIVQLTDFEQDSSITRRPSGTVFFLMAPLCETRNPLYCSMLRRIDGSGCLTAGFEDARRARGVRVCLSSKAVAGEPLARCSYPLGASKVQRRQAHPGNVASAGSPMASSLDRARDRLGGGLRVA